MSGDVSRGLTFRDASLVTSLPCDLSQPKKDEMADYLSLEEAAAKLGIPTDRLVELRSQGQIRGFRDGASWKFPESEIDRLRDELEDLGAGSGLLVSEPELGSAISSSSSSIIGGDDLLDDGTGSGSDLKIGDEPLKPGSSGSDGSDVNLVASDGNGSDVALVASGSDIDIEAGAVDSEDLEMDDDLVEIDSGESIRVNLNWVNRRCRTNPRKSI